MTARERQREEREYPKQFSDVDVTFTDGVVQRYRISAGITISQYLAKSAAETGILTLINDDVAHGIPINQVREYVIQPVPKESAA